MKKVVLIPDSFKGTLSSTQICEIIESKINDIFLNAKLFQYP